ncbi:MAG: hypothetical protein WA563_01950, partial [Candidatus Acidiferrales bacterium]
MSGIDDDIETVFLGGTVECHAKFLHDVQRGAIFGHGDGDDTRKMRAGDGVVERDARRFSGEAAAPLVFCKAPADFYFGGAVEFERLQAAETDQAGFWPEQHLPKAKTARGEMFLLACDEFADLIVGQRMAPIDVTHDVGIGEDGAGGFEIGERPRSEPEAFGFEVMIHFAHLVFQIDDGDGGAAAVFGFGG